MERNNQTGSRRRAKIAPQSRPTIKDIAQRCGVHPSTVSRALSSVMHHLVAEDVARRIRAAATALGYRPNITAAGLRTGRSGLIGVVCRSPGTSPRSKYTPAAGSALLSRRSTTT